MVSFPSFPNEFPIFRMGGGEDGGGGGLGVHQ